MIMGIRNGKPDVVGPYSCHNRKPLKETVVTPETKLVNGNYVLVTTETPFGNSTNCKYAEHGYAVDDIRCGDCQWIKQENGK